MTVGCGKIAGMKKVILCILALVLIAGCARTARIKRVSVKKPVQKEAAATERHLNVGEKLTYLVAWKSIPVGLATVTLEEITKIEDYRVYKIVLVAQTNKFLSKIFPVRDTLISYVDTEKIISRRYEAVIREGRYKKDLIVDYDPVKQVATYKNSRDGTVKTCAIQKDVRDPVCAAYYLRTIPLTLGGNIKLTVNLCENNYEIFAEISEEADIDLGKLGSFGAYLIKPCVMLKGEPQKRGKARGYVSTDEKRLPLFIVVKVLEIPWIGEVTATLKKIETSGRLKNR